MRASGEYSLAYEIRSLLIVSILIIAYSISRSIILYFIICSSAAFDCLDIELLHLNII